MSEPTKSQKIAFKNLQKIDPNAEVQWDEKTGVPVRLRGALSGPQTGDPETLARLFLAANKSLFAMKAPEEELQVKDISTDLRGNRHVRFQQMYKSLPVLGGELILHMNSENVIRGVNGRFTARLDLPTKPEVSAEKAKKTVLADAKDNKEPPGKAPMLCVFVHENKPYLAWHISVYGTDKDLRRGKMPAIWEYFIDGMTGKVIWRYNNLQTHTRTTGSGVGRYAGSVPTLNTVHNHTASVYQLIDQWVPSTARINTYAGGEYPLFFALRPWPISEDDDNNWSATGKGPEVDCHLYTRIVFDYFLVVHGRNSYDDAGSDMHIHAHALCYGSPNQAYWDSLFLNVGIGDGDGTTFNPFCALDVIAHEWTHAVTQFTANLTYYGESGALNESISDVFAALIDGDWLCGEDFWLNTAQAPALRNMQDPTNGGRYDTTDPIGSTDNGHQPDHYNDYAVTEEDNGGVHINSGIMNKAAYLIATGGTHRGITICEGLGRDVLGRLYYQALTKHLTSGSNFSDMRQAVLDSLDDLYSGDPRYDRWQASIINAFAAVGIGTAVPCPVVICYVAPVAVPCGPAPVVVPCLHAPVVVPCPHAPQPPPRLICPPLPTVREGCQIAPRPSCLPGPDPTPFLPKMVERKRVKTVRR